MYRYRLQDLVEVTGFLEQAPCLRFVGKEDQICDLRGEKLSEGFAADAIAEALAGAAVNSPFTLLAPIRESQTPGYALVIEALEAESAARLASTLESALGRNPHYAHCVRVGQLAPVRVVSVPPNAYERYAARLVAQGTRFGDIKPSALRREDGWVDVLRGGTAADRGAVSPR